MNYLEQEIVKESFNRCSFLRDLVISAAKEKATDKLYRASAINSLAHQTGLRQDFIEDNLQEIITL